MPFDSSYTVVPFNSSAGCNRNDDGSAQLSLNGWSFDFYGTLWSDLFLNNNGNVSFGAPFSTFSPSGFPVSGFPMVAPFWGDVDTRADTAEDGAVWYREWSVASGDAVNRIVFVWDNVGYYSAQTDKVSSFQLILTDGMDPVVTLGNNVCFCYDDMQWTTGQASMGIGGFGGVPATVGANQGNGSDFFQIGRFDAPGNAYDGPGGNNDGVDYLDGQLICFDVSGTDPNTPPIFVNPVTTFTVQLGDTLNFTTDAIGPELGETVSFIVDESEFTPSYSFVSTPGNPGSVASTYSPTATEELGTHVLRITAVDDAAAPLSATLEIEIFVTPASVGSMLCDPAVPNSTGYPATMWAVGSDVASVNDMTLMAADLPQMANGFYIVSQGTTVVTNPGGSTGNICIASTTMGRYNANLLNSGLSGTVSLGIDLMSTPLQPVGPVSIMMSETWYWQYWYRDTSPSGPTSNFTQAICVTFQ